MALSIASFLTMAVAGRDTTAVLNVFQVLELRSVIGLLILLPLVFASGGFAGDAHAASARCISAATSPIIPARPPGFMR